MEPFDHLYLETNILEAARWPLRTEKLGRFLRLCELMRVSIFLPQPVEIELEKHWLRHLRRLIGKTSSNVDALRGHVARASDEEVVLQVPNEAQVLAPYRARSEALKREWHTQPVPFFTSRSVEELFAMAAQYQLPFKPDQEGAGFQDAVIYLSILDHLRAHPGRIGALLTNDDVFEQDAVKALASAAGVELKVYRTIDAAYNALVNRIRQEIRQEWEARRIAATRALNDHLPMIREYMEHNLDVSGIRVGLFEEPVSVGLREVFPIQDQDVFPPLPDLEPAGPHKIEFSVRVIFAAVVERSAEPLASTPLRIGEERPTGMARLLPFIVGNLPQPPQRVTVPVPRTCDAEATAEFVSGAYTNIQMVGVALR